MNTQQLLTLWKKEEATAYIHGWDFSYINHRYTEETDLPWHYKEIVSSYLQPHHPLLDIDTGGGEFLVSLHHPYTLTSCTEGYTPNVALCKEVLCPLGIHFEEAQAKDLPFSDNTFDIVINRHGEYAIPELYRVLKPGGIFITEQVGEKNDQAFRSLLFPETVLPSFGSTLQEQKKLFEQHLFHILRAEEAFRPIKFYDVGALVWYANIISWEFPGFQVTSNFKELLHAQQILEEKGSIDGDIQRYLLVAKK